MIKRLRLIAVVVLLSAVLAACGAKGVSVNPDKDSVTITNDKGESIDISAGEEGKLPADFPLPAYQGAKIEGSLKTSTAGKTGWTATLRAAAAPQAVADFYEKALSDKGLKVTRTEASGEGSVSINLMGDSETNTAFIAISKDSGAAETDVLLSYGDK